MNNFTKEELEYLDGAIGFAQGISGYGMALSEQIRNKIQSMIDNYCEHNELIDDVDEDGHVLVKCKDCDVIVWHEKD